MTPQLSLELAAVVIFIATQLITYGSLRQQVKDIAKDVDDQREESRQLGNRVRALEIKNAAQLSLSKKTGG